ncbi:MAG: (4Fe-4S)-binding protein [Candidatus Methanomarinus sp.]|uniref:(4Fe-4S)-binding protein n=1 Tax=Candidatus Methanomarinus sp. TaxID=3386244 RepID=A0AC61S9H1_9EURY|nr:MAG: MinD superfamily P-loop ATPase, contains an inserted ferredoxin domain [ANME-2 cluster archaeon]TKY91074.1 MAG: (4Fe-4S)-binding protein [ANME-2 cluster archaeon]
MIISIASGKGGTGKTTVATNLALSIPDVQLLDCDVEEPDSHLFLNVKLNKIEDVHLYIPSVDKQKCNFCRECAVFCQYNAIAVMPADVLVFPELCHGCGGCMLVCPNQAITETQNTIGVIEDGTASGIEFYHGLLKIGEPMATPVIKALKKRINKNKTVILDSPPGTSCPMIETIRDTDYCLLVTEPTPFGLHDLKLAVGVVRALSIPFGVVINRDGIGDNKVDEYCQTEDIPVLMRIPQNKEIARLYSEGKPFVVAMPQWKEKFAGLYRLIQKGVEK